jgi:hypothetical protein
MADPELFYGLYETIFRVTSRLYFNGIEGHFGANFVQMKNTGSSGKRQLKKEHKKKLNGNSIGKKVQIDQSSFSEYGYTLLLETVISEVTGVKKTVKSKTKSK